MLALCVAALVLLATVAAKPHRRLYVASFAAVPQFYAPGLPASLFLVWMLLVLGLTFVDPSVPSPLRRVELPIGLLAAVTLLYTFVSPDPRAAILLGMQLLAWLGLLRLTHARGVEAKHLKVAAATLSVWVAVQAVLVIMFRLQPSLEEAFLRSRLADVVVGPSARALFADAPNNVLDPDKAGGLFVNGNVGSMFLGAAACVLAAFAFRFGVRWPWFVVALTTVAVVASGSKTGLILLVMIPFAVLILVGSSGPRGGLVAIALLPALAAAALVAPVWLVSRFPNFFSELSESVDDRAPLWLAARQLLAENPLLGLGFGGWDDYAIAAIGRAVPPHNFLLAAWINTGIAGLVLTVWIVVATTVVAVVSLRATQQLRQRAAVALGLAGVWWVYLHGLGDNTTVFGEQKSMILTVFAVALVVLSNEDRGIATPERKHQSLARERALARQR
jgi:O-antigen ligase